MFRAWTGQAFIPYEPGDTVREARQGPCPQKPHRSRGEGEGEEPGGPTGTREGGTAMAGGVSATQAERARHRDGGEAPKQCTGNIS